jgi:hypothetical protein
LNNKTIAGGILIMKKTIITAFIVLFVMLFVSCYQSETTGEAKGIGDGLAEKYLSPNELEKFKETDVRIALVWLLAAMDKRVEQLQTRINMFESCGHGYFDPTIRDDITLCRSIDATTFCSKLDIRPNSLSSR